VPEGLDAREASTVTLGAIALQGRPARSADPGETFVVLGLGVVGRPPPSSSGPAGARGSSAPTSTGGDRLALDLGMDLGVHPDDADDVEQVARLTDGLGADG
jgi:threonine dehydrogenase-like Zn-dependent dehydrogenase